MEKEIEKLLSYLCVDWGFCIPHEDAKTLKESDYLDADEFARAVLIAEEMDPDIEVKWRRKIRNKFRERFGQAISARDY